MSVSYNNNIDDLSNMFCGKKYHPLKYNISKKKLKLIKRQSVWYTQKQSILTLLYVVRSIV